MGIYAVSGHGGLFGAVRVGCALCAALVGCIFSLRALSASGALESPGGGGTPRLYAGFGYGLAVGYIRDFELGTGYGWSNGGILPYKHGWDQGDIDRDVASPSASAFEWGSWDTKIRFRNHSVNRVRWALGYSRGGRVRLEVEGSRNRFGVVSYPHRAGSRQDNVFLLLGDAAVATLSDDTSRLAEFLDSLSLQDLTRLREYLIVGRSGQGRIGEFSEQFEWVLETAEQLAGGGSLGESSGSSSRSSTDDQSQKHVETIKKLFFFPHYMNEPVSLGTLMHRASLMEAKSTSDSSTKWAAPYQSSMMSRDVALYRLFVSSAHSQGTGIGSRVVPLLPLYVASMIKQLPRHEKDLVAKGLALVVEGAEVVELSAVGATSVTLNACYDFPPLWSGFPHRVKPYSCLGLGGSLMETSPGYGALRLAHQLKSGLSIELRRGITLFADGTYFGVMGDSNYEFPTQALLDDTIPRAGYRDKVRAHFDFSYLALELGLKFLL
ncbi:MAG: P44/Msp2 family outer membrane protein [Anaplasma sp.]